jgi:hypothetical protein
MMCPLRIAVFSYFLPEFGYRFIKPSDQSLVLVTRHSPTHAGTLAEQFGACNRSPKHMTLDHRVAGSSPAGCKKLPDKDLQRHISSKQPLIFPMHPHSIPHFSGSSWGFRQSCILVFHPHFLAPFRQGARHHGRPRANWRQCPVDWIAAGLMSSPAT